MSDYLENSKVCLEMVKRNYDEMSAINDRIYNRAAFIMGATITAHAFILSLFPNGYGIWSLIWLAASMACLLSMGTFGFFVFRTHDSSQPGKMADFTHLWKSHVSRDSLEESVACWIRDTADCVIDKRKINKEMAGAFTYLLISSLSSLFLVLVSEITTTLA